MIALVMLCLLVAAPAVQAAPKTSYAGAWTSIDLDGSTQYMAISGGPDVHVTQVDLYGTICVRKGSPTTVFTASLTAIVTGATMVLTYNRARCGPVDVGMVGFQETWTYDPVNDQIWTGWVTWARR
jgi:hypothetical protein